MKNLFNLSWLIISIANKKKVVNLAINKDIEFIEMMHFDHLNSNKYDGLMSIEDLRALRLREKKIESDKKARKYILEINQRFRKMNTYKSNNFLKNMNPFKNAA